MFNFYRKKAEVLNHWIAFVDGFQIDPASFYTELEKGLTERKVPSMTLSRIDLAEGGLLSEKRTYLRMVRERLAFDVCAAPFGSGFFFSCRTAEIPVPLRWWHVAVFAVAGWLLTGGLFNLFSRFFDSFWLAGVLVLSLYAIGIYSLRNAIALGLQDLDTTLVRTPVVGPLYETFFRKETYHRLDSRLCYLEVVPSLVKKLAEDATAAKGIKLVRQYEVAPILGEIYKPSPPSATVPSEPPKA